MQESHYWRSSTLEKNCHCRIPGAVLSGCNSDWHCRRGSCPEQVSRPHSVAPNSRNLDCWRMAKIGVFSEPNSNFIQQLNVKSMLPMSKLLRRQMKIFWTTLAEHVCSFLSLVSFKEHFESRKPHQQVRPVSKLACSVSGCHSNGHTQRSSLVSR